MICHVSTVHAFAVSLTCRIFEVLTSLHLRSPHFYSSKVPFRTPDQHSSHVRDGPLLVPSRTIKSFQMNPPGGLILQRLYPLALLRTGPWRSCGSSSQLYKTVCARADVQKETGSWRPRRLSFQSYETEALTALMSSVWLFKTGGLISTSCTRTRPSQLEKAHALVHVSPRGIHATMALLCNPGVLTATRGTELDGSAHSSFTPRSPASTARAPEAAGMSTQPPCQRCGSCAPFNPDGSNAEPGIQV